VRRFLKLLFALLLVPVIAGVAQAQDSKTLANHSSLLKTSIIDPFKTAVNGALYTDIKQGAADTCWIDASLAALAQKGKDFTKLIQYQGDNWYTVSLFNRNNHKNGITGGYHREKVKVFFDGTRTNVDPQFDPKQPGESWMVIMQRAVLLAVHKWDPTQTIKAAHAGNSGDALAILTGRWPQVFDIKKVECKQKIIQAAAAGKSIIFATGTTKTLVKEHAYAVLKANAREVVLYNPWGSEVKVSWQTIKEEGNWFYII
jgi:Calpain family cysteine protease